VVVHCFALTARLSVLEAVLAPGADLPLAAQKIAIQLQLARDPGYSSFHP
jgi:hypothetical protein